MDAVEASYVGRMLAWMAMQGRALTIESGLPTTIERADGSREAGPRWRVSWDRGDATIFGLGHDLPGAVLDALRRLGNPAGEGAAQ